MHDKTAAYTANSGKQAFVKREWSKRESGFVAILFISSILVFPQQALTQAGYLVGGCLNASGGTCQIYSYFYDKCLIQITCLEINGSLIPQRGLVKQCSQSLDRAE